MIYLPPILKTIAHTIRRIRNKEVWYLQDHHTGSHKTVWTKKYSAAHKFSSKSEAQEFIVAELCHCEDECDAFGIDESWMG